MYWQVYLHKTVLAAEWMMMRILERAGEIARRWHRGLGHPCPCPLSRRKTWTGPVSLRTQKYWLRFVPSTTTM